jgi:hypothetical protein
MASVLQLFLSQCSNTAPTNMKSQSQISHQSRSRRGETRPARPAALLPVTDYQYRGTAAEFPARALDLKGAPPVTGPSFHQLSHDFIGSEMKRDYFSEAAFFAIIVGISAWSIVPMVHAMVALVK